MYKTLVFQMIQKKIEYKFCISVFVQNLHLSNGTNNFKLPIHFLVFHTDNHSQLVHAQYPRDLHIVG